MDRISQALAAMGITIAHTCRYSNTTSIGGRTLV